ncbi:hypothetical protein PWEIH_16768 [Listeria weihenstephanensis FSL R9-0317]|uniref:Uncharacterized protein n=1 Tax=Listeria weihenstephanensis TaxID=1006155 RepID=A0A1S7FXE8_9LIST|nr:hypothetical protein [Listeria weihenstephanensis]AQY52103.1 hypothetical protein UE46_14460 [Listeria weihenstephanensis]EUJ34750.1 hypothetical protein PWEIH_16768 [Listeria weihenstephanensis FSL R9-0317]
MRILAGEYVDYYRKKVSVKEAQGVVLGYTELELFIGEADVTRPFFKTAELHAQYAAKQALR